MNTLTFLGASGGAGTTTLAAISVFLLAEHGMRAPIMVAEESMAFNARLGVPPQTMQAIGGELIDGGRYTAGKASAAFGQGRLVLVGAHTPNGIAAQDDALADIKARYGQAGIERTLPVLCAAFGGPLPPTDRLRIPFDSSLAPGGAVSDALPALSKRTRTELRQQWVPVLRASYTNR